MTTDPIANTLAWYDRQAAYFAARTADLDLAPLYDRFLRHVRPGGRVLDAGCGVGRDALVFSERGYGVVAFDASEEMARLARERAGDRAAVHRIRFEDIDWHEEFDGIWCCASLLHVPTAVFPRAATRLAAALRPGGAWYMSFKLGEGERLERGRLFVDHTQETLCDALADLPIEIAETWASVDIRVGRETEHWLNAVAVRRRSSQPRSPSRL